LLQVQKMDALGKLTGGIAHDFNNLLTGIITSLELIQKRVADSRTDKVQFYAEAALNSAMSAASLTHRLLAFARQQPLNTRPVDINEHIRSLEDLLVRTIGEHIALRLELTSKAAIALVDPIQLESAVLNLVINARDALPQGGNIWVSTYAAYSHGDLKLADGAYVALSVRDDGTGIEHSVIDKVFDPFFTTKAPGWGCRAFTGSPGNRGAMRTSGAWPVAAPKSRSCCPPAPTRPPRKRNRRPSINRARASMY
jgi:signal transduction histidine kinase